MDNTENGFVDENNKEENKGLETDEKINKDKIS